MGIFKEFIKGWNTAREADTRQQTAHIEVCNAEMEKFHTILTDTVLDKTGKAIHEHDQHIAIGLIVYEVQAAFEIAIEFELPLNLHEHFATASLYRAGLPKDQAYGIVQATMQANEEDNSMSGRTGYSKLQESEAAFVEHIMFVFERLNAAEQLRSDLAT